MTDGDLIDDFTPGVDTLSLVGFGLPAGGAAFTQLNATDWQITPAGGGPAEVIHLTNGAIVGAGDVHFS
jgi:hypothetical protein